MFEDIIGQKETGGQETSEPSHYVLEVFDNGRFRKSTDHPSGMYKCFDDFVKDVEKECEKEKTNGKLNDYSISVNNGERKVVVDVHLC